MKNSTSLDSEAVRILLDTHVFIWMTADRARVSPAVLRQLLDPNTEVYFSAVISWEICVKRAKGRLHFTDSPLGVALKLGLTELPITADHCESAAALPALHADPFDRLLIAQAQMEGLVLATRDTAIARYGIRILRA